MTFNPNSTLDLDALWDSLGTFYTLIEPESKETIQVYWSGLVNGLEGLHYDLAQSHLTPYLEHTKGYIEDSWFEKKIYFEGNLTNCEKIYFDPPASVSGQIQTELSNGSTTGSEQTMEYRITSLYNLGESLPSDTIIINSGIAKPTPSNKVTLTWSGVSGVDGYNIYGRDLGITSLLATVGPDETTFVDSGIVAGSFPEPIPSATQTNMLYNGHPHFLPKTPSAAKEYVYTYASGISQYLTIPSISGVNSGQVLLENDDYEVKSTSKMHFKKRLHRTKFDVSIFLKTEGHPYIGDGSTYGLFINNTQNPELNMIRGSNYIFDVSKVINIFNQGYKFFLYSDASDPEGSQLTEPTTNSLISFVPDNTTPNTIYYGLHGVSKNGSPISVIDAAPKTGTKNDWLLIDSAQSSIDFREAFIVPKAYKVLPSLTQIYLRAFGAPDPLQIINSGVYEPFLSGWATQELEYTERRKLYGEHIKKWCHAMVTSSKKPPSLVNLERIYALTKGFPFSYYDGTIDSIVTAGDYNYIHMVGSGTTNPDETYMIDKNMTLNYGLTDKVNRYDILVSGINFYDRNKDISTISGIMQRQGEIYTYDVFPKQIAPNNIELWPYPADASHFIRPKVLNKSLIDEALTNVQNEGGAYIPPAPPHTDETQFGEADVMDQGSNQGGNY